MKARAVVAVLLALTSQLFAQEATFYRVGTGAIVDLSPDGNVAVGTDLFTAFYWTVGTGKVLIGEGEAYGVTNDTMIVGRFRDPNTVTPNGHPTLVAGYWKDGKWTSIGGLPGVDPFDSELYSHGYGVSRDGSTIVGMAWRPNYSAEAFYWTEATGVVPLGQDGGQSSRVNATNLDGSLMVGWDGLQSGPDRRAYLWDPAPHFLGSFDATYPVGECYGISPNGTYVVGNSVGFPFVWTVEDSMQHVIDPAIYPNGGTATKVNDSGTIVGGIDVALFTSRAFFKHQGEEPVLLHEHLVENLGVEGLEKWELLWANGISDDGSVMAGWGYDKSHFSFGDAYVVRFAPPTSNVAIDIAIDPAWLPVPAGGDTIPMELTFTNLSADSVSTFFSIHLTVPDGTAKSVIESHLLPLAPNQVIGQSKTVKILADGPPGTYSLVALWGDYLENSSSLSFEKSDAKGFVRTQAKEEISASPVLAQNSPNPFNPSTTISFSLPQQSHVTLEVFNTVGQRVAQLVDGVKNAGTHSVVFHAADLASGVYLYRLQTPGAVTTKKFILMK